MVENCLPHHWILDMPTPNGTKAVCKKCHEEKMFRPVGKHKWTKKEVFYG